jgi:hypothetical protein
VVPGEVSGCGIRGGDEQIAHFAEQQGVVHEHARTSIGLAGDVRRRVGFMGGSSSDGVNAQGTDSTVRAGSAFRHPIFLLSDPHPFPGHMALREAA